MTKATKPVAREVTSRHGPLVVTITSAGVLIRMKGKRTVYGPITYEQLFSIGAKLAASAAVADTKPRRARRSSSLKVGL